MKVNYLNSTFIVIIIFLYMKICCWRVFIFLLLIGVNSCKEKGDGKNENTETNESKEYVLPPLPVQQQSYLFENPVPCS